MSDRPASAPQAPQPLPAGDTENQARLAERQEAEQAAREQVDEQEIAADDAGGEALAESIDRKAAER